MNRRWTLEKFIEKSNQVHNNKYNYSKTEFISIAKKVTIICPEHGSFSVTPDSHLAGNKCYFCGREKALRNKRKRYSDEFYKKASLIHSNKYDYSNSKYIKNSVKLEIICPIHGSFWQRPSEHLSGRGCRKCGIESRSSQKRLSWLEVKNRFNQKHKHKYTYPEQEYKNTGHEILIICPIHGEFSQRAADHLKGKGCHPCGVISRKKKKTKTQKDFLKEVKQVHGDKYNYSKAVYVHGRKKVEIICPDHGSFWQTPEGHLSGRGCKKCVGFVSKKEIEWLDSLGIPKGPQYRNTSVQASGKKVRVDGFDPKTNTVYEFYGDYWHGNPKFWDPESYNERARKTHGELYSNTIKREKQLIKAGFKLITIWEHEWESRAV